VEDLDRICTIVDCNAGIDRDDHYEKINALLVKQVAKSEDVPNQEPAGNGQRIEREQRGVKAKS
jgi:hypothetical protein